MVVIEVMGLLDCGLYGVVESRRNFFSHARERALPNNLRIRPRIR